MIKAVTKQNGVIGEFKSYMDFHMWLLDSDWAVVDFGKSLQAFQRDGGVVTLEPINAQYLQKLNIK
nr:MAG TPA: hypothetical protein [Caudoviricetes sp.]